MVVNDGVYLQAMNLMKHLYPELVSWIYMVEVSDGRVRKYSNAG